MRLIGTSSPDARAAEAALCRRYGPRVRLYGLRHLRDEAAALDLMQQVLLAVLAAARDGRIERPDDLVRFVFGTCRNAASVIRRGERRFEAARERYGVDAGAASQPDWPAVDRVRLSLCLGRLPGRDRAVVLLSFEEDLDAQEISARLRLSAGNVRVIRHRALGRLRTCIEGGPEDAP